VEEMALDRWKGEESKSVRAEEVKSIPLLGLAKTR
jgi:hypothetical protein